ncbi:DUF148 domain-containing protein [Caenorhabditis elegans]|uniref:DUF148 domain-containing protein n=1 Tax=Caenorhabditis elegans TaxID=6239 RepID=E0AHB5_CAEEL|nr:DUF148 domain-containing protein [Caenorhabditis elegans]CBW44393.1 DUF148 domain-containing protein [Caenorhabditis elegans]|eukprot:NP_001257133.1 Uncharacterized protein CELE_W02H3.3 [Caenorhabditis elegans]
MDVPFQNPDVLRLAELQVNPILDALNNAFDEFSRVVKARPSLTTAVIVENIREELIGFVNVITMQMNTGNVTGLVNHLLDAQNMTQKIIMVTRKIRFENGCRGFHVTD